MTASYVAIAVIAALALLLLAAAIRVFKLSYRRSGLPGTTLRFAPTTLPPDLSCWNYQELLHPALARRLSRFRPFPIQASSRSEVL